MKKWKLSILFLISITFIFLILGTVLAFQIKHVVYSKIDNHLEFSKNSLTLRLKKTNFLHEQKQDRITKIYFTNSGKKIELADDTKTNFATLSEGSLKLNHPSTIRVGKDFFRGTLINTPYKQANGKMVSIKVALLQKVNDQHEIIQTSWQSLIYILLLTELACLGVSYYLHRRFVRLL